MDLATQPFLEEVPYEIQTQMLLELYFMYSPVAMRYDIQI
jgi:hypothetical protein